MYTFYITIYNETLTVKYFSSNQLSTDNKSYNCWKQSTEMGIKNIESSLFTNIIP